MSFTIGSLFDGSGGFPLAATMCGGTPKWASEVEPFPIAVTWSRFPGMKHLGSVTDIKGGEVEPVDVITFGSPCQDLSVAGKRAGLKHEVNGDDETTRSGLFMEAVRIIKEMREATNGVYPRFALWENVPGAFSSNKGEDFRTVLEELIKIVEPTAVMPEVPKNGWPYADSYCGDGWSLAYRVLDAQFWGVPQRRRRIYLVADFRGECAGKISFEREGLRGYFETGRTPWKTVAGDAENRPGTADCEGNGVNIMNPWDSQGNQIHDSTSRNVYPCLRGCGGAGYQAGYVFAVDQGGCKSGASMSGNNQPVVCYPDMVLDDQGGSQITVRDDGKCPTLRAETHGNVPCVLEAGGFCPETGGNDPSRSVAFQEELSPTLRAGATPAIVCKCYDARGNGDGTVAPTITGDHNNRVTDYTCVLCEPTATFCIGNGQVNDAVAMEKEISKTLNCMVDPMKVLVEETSVMLDRAFFNQGQNAKYDPAFYTDGTVPTLVARGHSAVAVRYIVRRLTPTECARLQGFPDTWGHPDAKTDLTDEEYQFWLNVRNTHAAINDKPTKEYTKDQILKWYNGLHTDSSEYKMWGNGIALPNALYMMQGIAEVMSEEKTARRKWLDALLGDCL